MLKTCSVSGVFAHFQAWGVEDAGQTQKDAKRTGAQRDAPKGAWSVSPAPTKTLINLFPV